eukprot:gene14366-15864_t
MAIRQYDSKLFLVTYFMFAMLEVFLMSGIIYGWSSITGIFEASGYFGAVCTSKPPQPTKHGVLSRNNSNYFDGKPRQDDKQCLYPKGKLNLVFNVAVSTLCGFKLIIGLVIDRFGPKFAQALGCLLYVAAGLGLAYTTKGQSYALFVIFILFSIGGGFIAVSKYQVSRIIYGRKKSLVLSMLHGSFNASGAVLLIFKVLHENGATLKTICLGYTITCLVSIIISTVLLTPSKKQLHSISIEEDNANVCDFIQSHEDYGSRARQKRTRFPTVESIDSISFSGEFRYKDRYQEKLMIPDSLKASICLPLYIYEILFLAVIQLKLWFYIGSLYELLKEIFKDDANSIDYYTSMFGYCQLCGIVAGPIIGCIFDRRLIKICTKYSDDDEERDMLIESSPEKEHCRRLHQSIVPFLLTSCMCICLCVLSLIKSKNVLVVSFVLHVVIRGFLYSSHAAFIGIAFKSQYFAILYGLGIFLAGVFGLSEYGLYVFTNVQLLGDPFLVNVMLLSLVVVVNFYPFHLSRHCKKIRRNFEHMTTIW